MDEKMRDSQENEECKADLQAQSVREEKCERARHRKQKSRCIKREMEIIKGIRSPSGKKCKVSYISCTKEQGIQKLSDKRRQSV
jgi:hypothetical protein